MAESAGKSKKKLMKTLLDIAADFSYEIQYQILRRTSGFAQESGRMPLCKTLWKACRKLADNRRNGRGKGFAGPSGTAGPKLL